MVGRAGWVCAAFARVFPRAGRHANQAAARVVHRHSYTRRSPAPAPRCRADRSLRRGAGYSRFRSGDVPAAAVSRRHRRAIAAAAGSSTPARVPYPCRERRHRAPPQVRSTSDGPVRRRQLSTRSRSDSSSSTSMAAIRAGAPFNPRPRRGWRGARRVHRLSVPRRGQARIALPFPGRIPWCREWWPCLLPCRY